jgi:hypothetical protein
VRETLRHELEHHLGYRAGSDPLDDAERDAIDIERLKRVGRQETQRRFVSAARRELKLFFARTWPVWLVALAATVLALMADRAALW